MSCPTTSAWYRMCCSIEKWVITPTGGDIVLVRIIEYPSNHSQPIGLIEQVLGQENAPGMEVTIAVNTHHIPHHWNEAVMDSIRSLSEQVAEQDKQGRRDMRQHAFVTIDGADARDFDDAVYCEPITNGFRLYVAIADVAHYVKADSALDLEARIAAPRCIFPVKSFRCCPKCCRMGCVR